MRLSFDEQTEAFRRVRGVARRAHARRGDGAGRAVTSTAHLPAWARAWQRTLFDAGWLVPGNPPEYGGRNATLLEVFVHQEEMGRRHIYPSFNPQGLSIIAPSLLVFGTEEQKRRWAVPILRGDMTAALGMSEPDAGSGPRRPADPGGARRRPLRRERPEGVDLGCARRRLHPGVRAHRPRRPQAQGHELPGGPHRQPGLTRRPFGSIGEPRRARLQRGVLRRRRGAGREPDRRAPPGWRVATGSLGHERAMLWLGFAERLDDTIEHGSAELVARGLDDDPLVLDWFGNLVVDANALRLLGYRTLAKARRGVEATEQSILKLFGSEAVQAAALHMLDSVGPDALDPGLESAPLNPLHGESFTGSWWERYLRSFAGTIAGGTSQIQRNIIAERVLGRPPRGGGRGRGGDWLPPPLPSRLPSSVPPPLNNSPDSRHRLVPLPPPPPWGFRDQTTGPRAAHAAKGFRVPELRLAQRRHVGRHADAQQPRRHGGVP